jgi:hypothetical protein
MRQCLGDHDTYDDGTGNGHTVDVCVPLAPTQGSKRWNEPCGAHAECVSNLCTGNVCRETCCTHGDCQAPFVADLSCLPASGQTFCLPTPVTDASPLGSLGCSSTGSPGDCLSNLCYTYLINDTGCTSNAGCSATRPTCFDYYGDGNNDCGKDICVDQCCSEADCPDYGTDRFFCGKVAFGVGDYDVCLLHEGTGTVLEGQACTTASQCRSRFCSGSPGVCRARCCQDAGCQDPSYPRCQLEQHSVSGVDRWVNVCLP